MIVRPWGVFGRPYKVGMAGAAVYWGCWALVAIYLVIRASGLTGVWDSALVEVGLITVVLLACAFGAVLTVRLGEPVEPRGPEDQGR